MSQAEIGALAKRFFDAIETGDVDAVATCYADEVEIWHNTDGLVQGKADNLAALKGLVANYADRRYGERRLDVFDGGFAQQHTLSAIRADGKAVSLPAALICRVKDGRITRLDEYFDSAHVAAFTGRG
jgi:ketosteroid isomerase-like protein